MRTAKVNYEATQVGFALKRTWRPVLQQILHQRQGSLVSHQSEVGMQLQDGAGSLGLDGAKEAVLHSLGLALAIGNQKDPLRLHNAADAHGVGMGGDIFPLTLP